MQAHSSSVSTKSGLLNPTPELQNASVEVTSKSKPKDKMAKAARLSHEEKKVGKSQDEKRTRARKMMEFHNIKISQVSLSMHILCQFDAVSSPVILPPSPGVYPYFCILVS